MCKQSRVSTLAVTGAILLSLITIPVIANDVSLELYVDLSDTTVQADAGEAWVSVYLANYQDTLAGFSMRISCNRPGVIEFMTDISDPYFPGGVDTVGSAISDWQYVYAFSPTPQLLNIKVVAFANMVPPPYNPGLPPQADPILLMRLKIRISEDLPFATDSLVNLFIVENLSETGFSDPSGNLIGTKTYYSICDTTYWQCVEWIGEECQEWVMTSPGSADSVGIDTFFTYWCCEEWVGEDCQSWVVCEPPGDSVSIDSVPWTIVDTSATFFGNGSVRIVPETCCIFPGDANNDGQVNVGDPVAMINYIFLGGPQLPCPQAIDLNGDCQINVADVVTVIRPIFNLLPFDPPQCAPDSCVYEVYE
jgi:hypothetical protein